MGAFTLDAQPRERLGKGGARTTRRGHMVPVVVYGQKHETLHLSVKAHDLELALAKHARMIELQADGKAFSCLIRDIQRHPVSEEVLHVDFLVVTPDQKISTDLPVRLLGNPVGVKQGGQLRRLMAKVKVSCQVSALPDFFDIDVNDLEAGRNLLVKDLHTDTIRLLNPDHVAVVQITKARVK